MTRLLPLAVLAAGCTVVPSPANGLDPDTGLYAVLVDLDDDGTADGFVTGCASDPAQPKWCGLAGMDPFLWLPLPGRG